MKIFDPKKRESFTEIQSIIERIAPKWKSSPNVIDIVPALKTVKGVVQTNTLVLGFYVREKVSPQLLENQGIEPIPAEIDGVPTDVIQSRNKPRDGTVDCKATRSQMFDTLAGGMAVGNAEINAYGTLAMILFAQSDGRPVGLTNEHVLVFDTDGHVGDEVQQPRFYLNSEVSIDPAACCPNGQLHYRGVDNPIVDAAVAVYAATAIAAALSDEIDPNRRGQIATATAPGERTLKETVTVDMNYPEMPLPGRPYKVKVKWKYDRHTDTRVLSHSVSETKENLHYVDTQELLTDKLVYARGNKVFFYALLGHEKGKEGICGNYFVTAAALSPSHKKAYKIILKPCDLKHGRINLKVNADKSHSRRRCIPFSKYPPRKFNSRLKTNGLTIDPQGSTASFKIQTPPRGTALQFPDSGITVRFNSPVQEVFVRGMFKSAEGVSLHAYSNDRRVGNARSNSSPDVIHVTGDSITHVVISGGKGEALIDEICFERTLDKFCVYCGELTLAPDEELGIWNTYLFAQTRNDVPLGTDPLIAAKTIGGLPITDNFSEGGKTSNITYGNACLVEINPNGSFEVVKPSEEVIG